MLSDNEIKRTWEGMLSAEIRANYFAELSSKLGRRQRAATLGTLLLSSGSVVSLLASLPPDFHWVRLVLALGATAISAYSIAMQNQKFAVDAADLHFQWNRQALEYTNLWEDVYRDDASQILKSLEERSAAISKAGIVFGYDEKAMAKWQEHVEAHHRGDLAHA